MPKCYQNFLYTVDDQKGDSVCALSDALKAAISASKEEIEKRHALFVKYASENLLTSAVAEKIIRMNFDEEA